MRASVAVVGLTLLSGLARPDPLAGEVLVRISAMDFTHEVTEVSGHVWVAMDSGAYRIDGNSATPVLSGLAVTTVADVGGQVWLGSERGVFQVEGDEPTAILREEVGDRWVKVIKVVDGVVWLGTHRGLYRIEGANITPSLPHSIWAVTPIAGEVWVATQANAYRLDDGGKPVPLFNEPQTVSEIVRAGGFMWLITNREFGRYGPCFRVDNGRPREFLSGYEVISAAEVEGVAWFATTRGVFRLVDGTPQHVVVDGLGVAEPVNTIAVVGGQVWVGTTDRAYRRLNSEWVSIPAAARGMNVKGIGRAAGSVWVWGRGGAFRFDEDVALQVRLTTWSLLGHELLTGRVVKIKGARYDRGGRNPYDGSVPARFDVILHPDRETFDRHVSENLFTPAESLERTVSYGFQDLHLMVRDAYGNTQRQEILSALVLPGSIALGFIAVIGWWLIAFLIVGAAPWSTTCMALLMSPASRRFLLLWAVLLATSFAWGRRHLLRFYIRELQLGEGFSGWTEGSGLPSVHCDVGGELVERRRLLLIGEPDATWRYLRFLTWHIATRKIGRRQLRKAVPVFLRVDLYAKDIETMENGAIFQLANFGGITDRSLAKVLLRGGGFVFLLDGLGQLDASGQRVLEQFIDINFNRNFFVIGSTGVSLKGFGPAIPLIPPDQSMSGSSLDQMSEQIGERIERMLVGSPLDNYEGYACVNFQDQAGEVVSSLGDELVCPWERRPYKISVWLQKDQPEGAFFEPIRIRGGQDKKRVSFSVVPFGGTLYFDPESASIEATPGERSPTATFSVAFAEGTVDHRLWIEVSQKNRLIQAVSTTIRVINGGEG